MLSIERMLNAAFYEPIASHQRFIAALPLMSNLIVSLNLFIALIMSIF